MEVLHLLVGGQVAAPGCLPANTRSCPASWLAGNQDNLSLIGQWSIRPDWSAICTSVVYIIHHIKSHATWLISSEAYLTYLGLVSNRSVETSFWLAKLQYCSLLISQNRKSSRYTIWQVTVCTFTGLIEIATFLIVIPKWALPSGAFTRKIIATNEGLRKHEYNKTPKLMAILYIQ